MLGGVVVVEQYRVTPRFAAPPFAVACAIIASSRWAAASCYPPTVLEAAWIFVTASVGMYALAAAMQGSLIPATPLL